MNLKKTNRILEKKKKKDDKEGDEEREEDTKKVVRNEFLVKIFSKILKIQVKITRTSKKFFQIWQCCSYQLHEFYFYHFFPLFFALFLLFHPKDQEKNEEKTWRSQKMVEQTQFSKVKNRKILNLLLFAGLQAVFVEVVHSLRGAFPFRFQVNNSSPYKLATYSHS